MTEFHPPMSERETDELIEIANCTDETIWVKEASENAKKELVRRNISQAEQDKVIEKWNLEFKEYIEKEAIRLKNNETESYKIWEMVVLFIFGPILFFKPHIFNTHTIFTLKSENYQLKFKQRIAIFILSFIAWYIYLSFST